MPPESSHNIWAHSLQAIFLNKSCRQLLHSSGKNEANAANIRGNDELIVETIKLLCKGKKDQPNSLKTTLNHQVLLSCVGLANKVDRHSVSQVREALFNLLE